LHKAASSLPGGSERNACHEAKRERHRFSRFSLLRFVPKPAPVTEVRSGDEEIGGASDAACVRSQAFSPRDMGRNVSSFALAGRSKLGQTVLVAVPCARCPSLCCMQESVPSSCPPCDMTAWQLGSRHCHSQCRKNNHEFVTVEYRSRNSTRSAAALVTVL
jgi:hypothetical protein